MTTIFTIGYQGVRLADFIAALKAKGITRVVDCRSKPWSHNFVYSKDRIKKSLENEGIEYRWMPALGGKTGKREEGWDEALQHLITRSNEAKVIAVLCREHDPAECHRGLWITPDLEKLGITVEHVFAPQTSGSPKPKRNRSLEEFFYD